ncbi:hypothetical protein N7539_001512 [Penicillium diatomitis]|uniref:Rab-GAP TBC domain-containing protein n=1 Tax=Penicillium diatomitis TaxID=2819901 RepID=A0A9W9XGX2_9EURO|nr:uncharacterized protein N7539_001512 [Penicillium diatomitis]KAJ5492766.1 hypothetical protein N7539_001512 [Penicillium diatomitis]
MRTLVETRKRWDVLFPDHATSSDLRAALDAEQGERLCTDGLRSVCWKTFLLFDNVERADWSRKLAESRDAYVALRAHFLKYIEHPDDLESTVDPLADDDESPWQTLRNDEKLRAEIVQDVDRCLQENFFFQEPSTKRILTEILFVYSKLNPDVGYRQGMHELLAPIVWVIDRDSLERSSENGEDVLMQDVLDSQYIEHDSFTLFLCVMQTARVFYEHGETKSANGQVDVIPIVNRCQYLHQEALSIIDNELAEHLRAVDVLPQIFLTRWMRLLFGREFSFEEVLEMWDLLFAHGLRSDLVDFTCIAMLLRIRWQLLEADYSGALSILLRYPSPEPHSPQTFVRDALYLEQNPTAERGVFLISKYSGRPPESSQIRSRSNVRPAMTSKIWEEFKRRSDSASPTSPSARNSPKSLESLLQDVSLGIQRRTEAWGVAKAVRGAVTEARRNMQTMNYEAAPRFGTSRSGPLSGVAGGTQSQESASTELKLQNQLNHLEQRNRELASTLGEALKDLREQLASSKDSGALQSESIKDTLDRVQSVQICLEESTVPLAPRTSDNATRPETVHAHSIQPAVSSSEQVKSPSPASPAASVESPPSPPVMNVPNLSKSRDAKKPNASSDEFTNTSRERPRSLVRPSLADSGFSWMLGGNRTLSTFVSPASVPPEQTRHHDQPRSKNGPNSKNHADEAFHSAEAEQDELALHNLSGSRGPL